MGKWSKIFCACMISGIMLSTVGCGNSQAIQEQNEEISTVKQADLIKNEEKQGESFNAKEAIKIEDIDWNVTESILDGERFISFNYTNNSKYTVLDVEVKFVQKEGITGEQLSVFNDLKEDREWSDEEVSEIYILGYNRKCADQGETVSDSPCVINGTYTLVENIEQYNLMEPEMFSIAFIGDDGKGYSVYYDYKTNSYGESSNGGQELQNWSNSSISNLIPKVEAKAIKVSSDDEDRFFFYSYGITREEFEVYVQKVKDKGFTDIGFEGTDSYRASNADGFEINITFTSVEETMTGCIEKKSD